MAEVVQISGEPLAKAPEAPGRVGLYVYCVVPSRKGFSLDRRGMGGRKVRAVAYQGLYALVHRSMVQPYLAQHGQLLASWAVAHHRVVEAAWRLWGAVLPVNFNTVVWGEDGLGAEERLGAWLQREYEVLLAKLESLAERAEFGVQVYYTPEAIGQQAAQRNPEIGRLQEEMGSLPPGAAYMYRQRLEALQKREMESWAAGKFEELYGRLSSRVEKVRVERGKGATGQPPLLMSLSCLVSLEACVGLREELEGIGVGQGLSIRVVGPFPPYSFC